MPTASTVDHAAGPLQAFGVSFVFFPLLLNGSFGFAQDDGRGKPMEKQSTLYRYSPVHAHCLHRRPRFVILSAAEGSASTSPMHAFWH